MRKYIYTLIFALVLPLFVNSCKEDVYAELSETCYISSFSLGTLQRIIYGRTMSGMDSIYTVTFASTYYPMTIDQRRLVIENKDSLPLHTNLSAVTTSAGFEGILVWRKADIKNLEDTTWHSYSSSDSLDLRTPIHLRLIPQSGHGERIYTLKVNVHQQESDSTNWDSLGHVDELASIGQRRALIWEDSLTILGEDADGHLICVKHNRATNGEWTRKQATGAEKAVATSVQKMGDHIYLSTTDGKVLQSTDGIKWTSTTYPAKTGLRLVAASNEYLYALADGLLFSSNGGEWMKDSLDDAAENLPTKELNSVFYNLKDGTPRLLIVGECVTDTTRQVTLWAKSWDKNNEASSHWMYYSPNQADKYRCPLLQNLCIVAYDDGLQALGGWSYDGSTEPLANILHSSDHGISWKTYDNDDMIVDERLKADARYARNMAVAVDSDNFMWIVLDNKVWRGRINRLASK
jgi:hypothetical protein